MSIEVANRIAAPRRHCRDCMSTDYSSCAGNFVGKSNVSTTVYNGMGYNHSWNIDADAGTVLQCAKVFSTVVAWVCHFASISVDIHDIQAKHCDKSHAAAMLPARLTRCAHVRKDNNAVATAEAALSQLFHLFFRHSTLCYKHTLSSDLANTCVSLLVRLGLHGSKLNICRQGTAG